jgi:hypothetical protein
MATKLAISIINMRLTSAILYVCFRVNMTTFTRRGATIHTINAAAYIKAYILRRLSSVFMSRKEPSRIGTSERRTQSNTRLRSVGGKSMVAYANLNAKYVWVKQLKIVTEARTYNSFLFTTSEAMQPLREQMKSMRDEFVSSCSANSVFAFARTSSNPMPLGMNVERMRMNRGKIMRCGRVISPIQSKISGSVDARAAARVDSWGMKLTPNDEEVSFT